MYYRAFAAVGYVISVHVLSPNFTGGFECLGKLSGALGQLVTNKSANIIFNRRLCHDRGWKGDRLEPPRSAIKPPRSAIKRGRGIAAAADLLKSLSDRQFSWPSVDFFCLNGKYLGHYHYEEKLLYNIRLCSGDPMKKLSSIDDCGPDRAFIVEGQNVQFDYTPRSSELLICFDNLSLVDRGFPRAPWLLKYAANLGYSILGVQAYTKDWYRTTTLTLMPTVNDPNATVVVNNGNPIALAVGANAIPVEVTAQDGTTKITYTVTVTRAAALQAVIAGPTTPVSGPFSVVITFSQPVTQFTMADVTVVNGTATTMTGSGTTYTLTVSPTSASNVSISLPAGAVSGAGGTVNTASNVINVQAGTPASALAAAQPTLEQIVLRQAQKTLSSQASIDQRMIRSGMQRLVQRQRLNRQQSNRFLPLDVDGAARFDNGEFRLNGDFFALSSVAKQSAEVVTTGAFNFVSDRDGNFSGYFNGRSSLEVQLAHDMVLGYFLGVEVGRARLSGTFSGRQDSYGLNAGGYVLRSFNDVSYITGFAALGRNKNQLVVSNGTLQVDSDFDSTTLRLGASATGVFKTVRIEIWPELSFSYAKSRVGSQVVAAQAYGLTANNLSLAGGDVEMGQLMFMPQIKWPLGDGRDGAAVANFSLSPRLTCRVTRGVGGSRDCGTGAALGYSAASGDGLTLFNATVEFDNVADTKNGPLTFNVEHNF